ncbi:hypothetical protein EXIGLDRAFT_728871 [Exidia glandulosa HHB12029]|uniref:Uncharacterized protein n=1 Tax=Exidia glandulosa HHB12029 TaxID=1314781 RepID=A0A165CTE3_EXIGL|nr:hypothetical protein EXIGLDRAFT_728871 [Exidia glandulosa HHB12029]
MWTRSYAVPAAHNLSAPRWEDPERWPTYASGLFRANARTDAHEWHDIWDMRWANPRDEHASFQLINWTVNHNAGAQGLQEVLRQLQAIIAPLEQAGAADRSDVSSIYASSSRSTVHTRGSYEMPARHPQSPSRRRDANYVAGRSSTSDPEAANALGISAHDLPSKLVGPSIAGGNSGNPGPFQDKWDTVHHPCVIHLQGVTRDALLLLIQNDWLKRQFSLTPGPHLPELGGGWPASASYGNVTLVSHSLAVPARPFILHFHNSDPKVAAHAIFVTVRICLANGRYRHVLLCNSSLEPGGNDPYDKLHEQYEQMHAVAMHLFTQDPSANATTIAQSAGVFCGRAKRGVRGLSETLTLVDATEKLRYQANSRVLHTAENDLRIDVGTVGTCEDGRWPGGLAAKIWFEEQPTGIPFQPEWT